MKSKLFTCFYPSRPFWAVSPVNFKVNQSIPYWFTEQMSEHVYTKIGKGVEVSICRDGCILIRINRVEELVKSPPPFPPIRETAALWSKYLDYLNALYLLIESATIKVDQIAIFNFHEITTRDAFRVIYEDNKVSCMSVATESYANMFQKGRFISNYSSGLLIEFDSFISHRFIVSHGALDVACTNFMKLIDNEEEVSKIASLAKSLAAYKVGNYQISILLSWFIIESLLSTMWSQHLETKKMDLPYGKKRINSKRREFLTGRDFPISTVSNLLELEGLLDHSSFEKIDQIRGCRNKIVHGGNFKPEHSDAQLALQLANEMTNTITQIEINLNFSYSVSGI